MIKQQVLIAGIGNIFLGDDAFGCEVLKHLGQRPWPEDVRVVDFGIRGFDLAYALLEGYDLTIFVDATPRGGTPGTIYVIEPDLSEPDISKLDSGAMAIETHGMNPLKVLSLVKSMGGKLNKVMLVGCEPETFGPEEGLMGLSQSVTAAVPEAVKIVESLVGKHLDSSVEVNA